MKVPLLALFAAASAIQLPFLLNQDSPLLGRAHYSTLLPESLPIDLTPYENNVVLRVDKTPEVLLYVHKHGARIWAKDAVRGTMDVQLHSDQADEFVLQFTLAKVIIRDLPQAVFESYPEGVSKDTVTSFSSADLGEMEAAVKSDASTEDKLRILGEVFFKLYRPLDTICAWMGLLAQTYPDIVTIETIGHTYEGRPYQVLHVSVQSEDISHDEKKTIVVTGGVHAREWISVSSVLYSVYEILNHYESNPGDWAELAKLDFLFIPVSNPDGYEYSWSTDRLWRKNRQPQSGDSSDAPCRGIDIDHSYDFHWTKLSDNVCGEEFSGNYPFEAIELQVWDSYLNRTNEDHKIWGYIDLHSYSQEILYPYAYSCDQQPRDEENLIELAYGISKAIRLTSGKYYNVLPACIDRDSDLIPDMGLGSALDYMYHHKLYWAYQIKLRDSGLHGFLLPDKYIQPVGEEIAAGLKVFCHFILSDD